MSDFAVPGQENQAAPPTYADLFRKMAESIERNGAADFGGAVVIVPPSGNPVEILILNSQKDNAQFWGTLDATVKAALADMDEAGRAQEAWRRR